MERHLVILVLFYFLTRSLEDVQIGIPEFKCTSVGKFVDPVNPHRYHQCFYLFGTLTYIHNTCPFQTCFSADLNYCLADVCKEIIVPDPILGTNGTTTSYNCTNKPFKCTKKGVFAHPKDPSIYHKCSKIWGRWTSICYTCNSKHKTCFDDDLQACIPNGGKPCSLFEGPGSSVKPSDKTTYDCEGYDHYPCYKLGIGLHGLPGDASVYVECTKNSAGDMVGKCLTCPKKGNTCFVEIIDQCVERCGRGNNHKPYNCSTYTAEDISCETEGLIANQADASVFFNCVKKSNSSEWDPQCFTCSNGKTKTCFSEAQQACVTYFGSGTGTNGQCPSATTIDAQPDSSDVGTADNSLTWDCSGYNDLSFPCGNFAEDEYETPGDRSVYFACKQKDGKMVAECKSCPSEEFSCYDGEKGICVKDCVPRIHLPYDCRTYDEKSYPCTEEGLFANPNDTSIYHQCRYKEGSYHALCYTCSSGTIKTCFDVEQQACVTNGATGTVPCDTVDKLLSNPAKGTKENSLTYSADGYSAISFPCKIFGPGQYEKPGDKSVFVICGNTPEETKFQACPKELLGWYDKEKKACVENLGRGAITTTTKAPRTVPSYTCEDVVFECQQEGVFAYPTDTSIYIQCQSLLTGGPLQAFCYTCNKANGTCYSEEQKSCVWDEGKPCGDKESLKDFQGKPHLGHKCKGYTQWSFPCELLGAGFFPVPGDVTVYLECYTLPEGDLVEDCHSCYRGTFYDAEKKTCTSGSAQHIHMPYNCSTYKDEEGFPCSKAGYFANSLQTSIYFQCVPVKKGEVIEWQSHCYTCNSKIGTCFNEKKQRCVLNEGKPCGNTTMPMEGGSKLESLSHSCEGYTNTSFPCDKRRSGVYAKHGDPSVYWSCVQGTGECLACPKEKNTCYDEVENRCIENCGLGPPPKPYSCLGHHSFKCTKEGLFANTGENSLYFRCSKGTDPKDPWLKECFTCNSHEQTCFDEIAQACVSNEGRPCGDRPGTVESKINVETTAIAPRRNASRMHTCLGYEGFAYNCRVPGNFTKPGDQSVYYTCSYNAEKVLLPHCKSCSKKTLACFNQETNECVDNCGRGSSVNGTVRPYDCSGYHLNSFPCKITGLFAHPLDPTVFFHCLQNRGGQWESRCYSCNSVSKSCFSNKLQRCVIGCLEDTSEVAENAPPSLTYGDNCRGYGLFSIPCGPLTAKQGAAQVGFKTYYAHLGDMAVYFSCIQVGLFFQAFCHLCPISSCFHQNIQSCGTPCPDYQPGDSSDPLLLGPPAPYDCRFYTDDSYPCTQEGVFANPVQTSVYFQCVKLSNALFRSVCYTCHSKLGTCYNEAKGFCFFPREEGATCGTVVNTKFSPKAGKSYDCSGYEPKPSLPCSLLGAGTWSIPGDPSVYFTCDGNPEAGYKGTCHTCAKEKAACFDASKHTCVDRCILVNYKPYSCEIYDDTSFACITAGYFAQTFDSSVFFRCVKQGKTFKAECHTCNYHLKTCFSNKLQTCLTKGGQPCGEGDPHDALIGGTEEGSKHYECQGYNPLSFPCSSYGGGKFGSPADPTIYFNCLKLGETWSAECSVCSRQKSECFDSETKTCVENCGLGPNEAYSCLSYDYKAITCSKEGYFGNGKDGSSVYFKCVKSTGLWKWKTYCYSCNSEVLTCFDEGTDSCLTNGGQPCSDVGGNMGLGTSASGKDVSNVIIKGSVEDSRTYDCEGYNELSIPCELYGPGSHVHPGDMSVYFDCMVRGGILLGECHTCDASRRECYIQKEKKCVENCGLGPHRPWDCTTRKWKCVTEGLFADPHDNSVFYKCLKKPDGILESQCFTCNNGQQKTCFSQKKKACLLIKDTKCSFLDPADIDSQMTPDKSLTYDCLGYNPSSFPCDKYPTPGTYATPAEKSVYFECKSPRVSECKICPANKDSIFDPVQRKCVDNFGKGPHQPYRCDTYYDKSFKCKKTGYFGAVGSNSVFFKCVKKGNEWESHCYTCSSTKGSCFSDTKETCIIPLYPDKCRGQDTALEHENVAAAIEKSRDYACNGYNEYSFPCAKHSPGIYGHPGDLSVSFQCQKQDNSYVAVCKACDKTKLECFDNRKEAKKCVVNCLHGPVRPYDCTSTYPRSYPCSKEGGYFAHPQHPSLYFRCIRIKETKELEAICYSCSEKYKTCFSDQLQACITLPEGQNCKEGEDPANIPGHGNPKSSRTYDKSAYANKPPSFPCAKKGVNIHYSPGDDSVYVYCEKKEENGQEVWKETFHTCGERSTEAYFHRENRLCEYPHGNPRQQLVAGTNQKERPKTPKPQEVGKQKYVLVQRAKVETIITKPTLKPQNDKKSKIKYYHFQRSKEEKKIKYVRIP